MITKTKCTSCGKDSDGLQACYLDGEAKEHLCPDCIENSGYCMGCGQFWAGVTSFDFSSIPGYCEHCVDEIKSTCGEYDDDDDDYWDDDLELDDDDFPTEPIIAPDGIPEFPEEFEYPDDEPQVEYCVTQEEDDLPF